MVGIVGAMSGVRNRRRLVNTHAKLVEEIRKGNHREVEQILQPIRYTEECYSLLSKGGNTGQYPLHYKPFDMSLSMHGDEKMARQKIVKAILGSLPRERKFEYLKLRDEVFGQTALHTAALSGENEVISILLQDLSVEQRIELVTLVDYNRLSVLQHQLADQVRSAILNRCLDQPINRSKENKFE